MEQTITHTEQSLRLEALKIASSTGGVANEYGISKMSAEEFIMNAEKIYQYILNGIKR